MRRKLIPYPTRCYKGRYEAFVHNRWVSRQRAWQIHHKAVGLCKSCNAPIDPGSSEYCAVHHVAQRKMQRKRQGCEAVKADSLIGTGNGWVNPGHG